MHSPSALVRLIISLSAACVTAGTFAHTTLETVTMSEGVRVLNNIQIGHACGAGKSVIGTSLVFPDGVDSTVLVNGAVSSAKLSDFLVAWGPNIQPLIDRSVFTTVDEKNGPTGNVVGMWAGGGPGMPNHMVGYVPFRVNATSIVPTSCALSVRFQVSIIDVCSVTTAANLHDEGVAEFWTSSTLGTIYDSKTGADDSARLTITRNTITNPLPASCGAGNAVEVRISPAQMQRDMPIRINGAQVWPK